jgi:glycosyltransferase involved in cell wall biosynthesis
MPGNKPRIVFINHWARGTGGAEVSLMDILKDIAPLTETHLITSEDGRLCEIASELKCTVHVVKCSGTLVGLRRNLNIFSILYRWKSIISFLKFIVNVRKVVKKLNPDLIHANVPKSHVTLFSLNISGYKGSSIYHIREIFDSGAFPTYFYRLVSLQQNAVIIAISNAVKESLPSRAAGRAVTIYNGVNTSHPALGDPLYFAQPRYLYLGRIVPWKGCNILIEAFAKVNEMLGVKAGRLDIVGDTLYWDVSYREELKKLIHRYKLEEFCSLLPYSDNPEEYYLSHNIFCIGSDREPFGRVIAEAQSFGLPVIGFANGGTVEIVENEKTAITVPFGDINSFANAMVRLAIDCDLRKRMGVEGRKRVLEFFNRDIQIPQISAFLLSMVEKPVPFIAADTE